MKLKGIHAGFIHCELGHHKAFNQWHDFDHRPENHALPHIFHSQRWVAPPDYIAVRDRVDDTYFTYGGGEYFVTYWTEGTLEDLTHDMALLRDQTKLLGRFDYEFKSLGLGRDPERFGWDRKYDFIKAWTRESLTVSASAVPLMPHEGIYVVLSEVIDGTRRDEWSMWYDMTRVHDILKCKGFMAAFRFAVLKRMPTPLVLDLYFLDEEPLASVANQRAQMADWDKRGRGFPEESVRNVLLCGPYRPITPGQYDFYD